MFINGGGTTVAATSYPITNSLRCSSASSQRLSRTFGTPTTQNTFTISIWVKRGVLGVLQNLFGVSTNNSIGFTSTNTLVVTLAGSATITTTQVYRDPAAWLHIVYKQTTGASELYVNGTSVGTSATVSSVFNTAVSHQIASANTSNYLDGYITEIKFIDGSALSASSFGETEAETGQWVANAYSGSYGANGFYLDFLDGTSTTTLGDDKSGNNNDWTLTNFTRSAGVNDCWMLDVPAGNGSASAVQPSGNYATINPLKSSASFTLFNGNLSYSSNANGGTQPSTIAVSAGKWVWEVTANGNFTSVGIVPVDIPTSSVSIGGVGAYCYYGNGQFYSNVTGVAYGASFTTNNVIRAELDLDNNQIEFFKNGTSQGVKAIVAGTYNVQFGSAATATNVGVNLGQRQFVGTPTAGFKALCTANLTSTDVIESGSFTGNASADGPFIWCNGTPETLTINGNAVTWGTHADRLSNGFKLRTSSSSYNSSGTNTWTATILSPESKSAFKHQNAKGN